MVGNSGGMALQCSSSRSSGDKWRLANFLVSYFSLGRKMLIQNCQGISNVQKRRTFRQVFCKVNST